MFSGFMKVKDEKPSEETTNAYLSNIQRMADNLMVTTSPMYTPSNTANSSNEPASTTSADRILDSNLSTVSSVPMDIDPAGSLNKEELLNDIYSMMFEEFQDPSSLTYNFNYDASDECAGGDGDDVIAVGACGRDWDDVDDAGGMELDS
ncbi:hypothetical protein JL09_g5793 [Pichia kudriavzevii]|nr:hypothetical protein JL09_g5793 [Pichia kudriavzevii]